MDDRFPTEKDWQNNKEEDNIEGLIFKIKDVWVANFNVNGQNHRCQVDFNPFTGEKLK